MNTTTPTPTTAGARSHHSRSHLRPPLRKAVLVAHLLSAGAWVGIDVIVAVLVLVGWFGQGSTAGLAYRALGTFAVVPMLVVALVCLATGLLLGLATRWGLVRYWWVLVKLVLTVVLCVLIVVALQPRMPEVVAHGEAVSRSTGTGSTGSRAEVIWLFFPPAVSLTVLGLATGLAVYKPWGRLPRRNR
ncbi:hypothetical protein [Ruania albidiflava]|uniref:hypothetical protein n=1 Tax=Ruania albidiflava TaxID=366586 RepID=UPI0003B37B24|nr:hypothetical protein [Ruania albidiflava]